ncbi:MAG: cobalamin-dependent protein [Candidatus Lokiarchaeota archaeon]|nr:cobalamin-dependent protein [Candidatus Lokiarchaeota archaeon]
MSNTKIIDEIREKIVGLDLDAALGACRAALDRNVDPIEIIEGAISRAVDEIGHLFEKGEFFLPELIFTGEILTRMIKIIDDSIEDVGKRRNLGKVIIGTGKGDLHDIGKNIVTCFLVAEGFDVIDLGVDVTADKFIDAIKKSQPKILAISALLSSTMLEIIDTMKAIEKAGIRDKVKIILGGAPMNQAFAEQVGADASARNAMEGVRICKRWVES